MLETKNSYIYLFQWEISLLTCNVDVDVNSVHPLMIYLQCVTEVENTPSGSLTFENWRHIWTWSMVKAPWGFETILTSSKWESLRIMAWVTLAHNFWDSFLQLTLFFLSASASVSLIYNEYRIIIQELVLLQRIKYYYTGYSIIIPDIVLLSCRRVYRGPEDLKNLVPSASVKDQFNIFHFYLNQQFCSSMWLTRGRRPCLTARPAWSSRQWRSRGRRWQIV